MVGAVGLGMVAVAGGGVAAWLKLARQPVASNLHTRSSGATSPTTPSMPSPTTTPVSTPLMLTQPLYTYHGHTRALNNATLAWSPQPGVYRIASGGWDGLQVWGALTGANAVSLWTTDRVTGLAWSPDGRKLAIETASNSNVRVGDLLSRAIIAVSSFYGRALGWSPNGQRIASASSEPFVQVWQWQSGGAAPMLWRGHTGETWAVAWSRNGKYLASGSEDQTAIVWDATSGTPLKVLKAQETPSPVIAVSWSPDTTRLAVAHKDGTVWVWDAMAGKQLYNHIERSGYYPLKPRQDPLGLPNF